MSDKLFIEDIEVTGKRVLVRVDFNVPLDEQGRITNDKRIAASLPTIEYLVGHKAKVILMSHLGRPKGERKPRFSLSPVAEELKKRLAAPVSFVEDCVGEKVAKAVEELAEGGVLLLENLRFYKEETDNDPTFAGRLAEIADIYVNDAFGTAHRAHASTEGVTHHVGSCAAGYLMKKELDYLGKALENPERPFVAVLGGAKISGKIDVIRNLLEKVDSLIVGGAMAFTFEKAQGKEIGKSLLEEDKLGLAADVLQQAEKEGKRLLLPVDYAACAEISDDAPVKEVPAGEMPSDLLGVDIGPRTIEMFGGELRGARTIVWNGPMGVFEKERFARGTFEIAKVLADCTAEGATTIIGGGDSASAISSAGLSDKVTHVSTGGGASLEFLEGKTLPGIAALSNK